VRARIAPAAAGIGLALSLAAGCGGPPPTRGIVMISLDTTRADRLGCYGYDLAETPNLDALAEEGVVFLQAQAPVPVTLPTHSTMFTGTYPPRHGVRYNGMFRLQESSVTVAEVLRDAGWSTAGVPASYPLSTRTGIGQGFQIYDDMFAEPPEDGTQHDLTAERSAGEITEIGVDLLEQSRRVRFFLWLHYWDAHYPYQPPFPYSSSHRDRPYDGEIAYMDREIGKLFDALRELGLWDSTLVVVVGDHGEGLYDHNEKMHANLVYQSTMRVPLIVKPPGSARHREIEEPVSLADIAPTLLDFAGVAAPETEGVSLKPAVFGERPPRRDIYFESLAGSLVYGWSRLQGVRSGPWKYVRSRTRELFDLQDDPSESRSIHDVESERAAEMERRLAALEAEWEEDASSGAVSSTPLDQEELDALASLGYIGGVITEERDDAPDPRHLIHLEVEALAARREQAARDHHAVLARTERILAEDPNNRHALAMAGMASYQLEDLDQALGYVEHALERYPESLDIRLQLGNLLIAKGELGRALEVFRKGLDYAPDDAGLIYRIAAALYALDRVEEAREIIDPILVEPANDFPEFWVLRAACRAKQGDPDRALEDLRQAIEGGYTDRKTLETEVELEPLRAVPGFEELVSTLPEPPPRKGRHGDS
jgi:arylsulfatase A-like enzyme